MSNETSQQEMKPAGVARDRGGLVRMRAEAVLRLAMVHGLSGPLRLYVVTEYPKSGGTWVGQMLSAALGVPFPRNRAPVLRSSIMHGHYLPGPLLRNPLIVWRDGRDVMVSWYFHCLFRNERSNGRLVDIVRRDLPFADYEDVTANLPSFIEYAFTTQRHPRFSWADFVRRWSGARGCSVRYEDLRQDTAGELIRIVRELAGTELSPSRAAEIAQEFSFSRQAGRAPGETNRNSFLRKGVVGDWRNQFSDEARQVFDRYAGEELVRLGYEADRSWLHATAVTSAGAE